MHIDIAQRSCDGGRARVLAYYLQRVRLCLRISDAMEVVPRTSELARVFGLDFMSVLTRGSQYRVESMLCRLARAQVPLAPPSALSRARISRSHPTRRSSCPLARTRRVLAGFRDPVAG